MAVPPETTTTNTPPAPTSSNVGNASKHPTSSHRLPTVSASEAFRDLSSSNNDNGDCGENDSRNYPLSNAYTGIAELDDALGGGFECGKVTELWGPPGAGKTAVALSAAASVLQKGSSVVWIDTTHPLSPPRLTTLPQLHLPSLQHTHTATLSHLLTLLLHPPPTFPPRATRLLVLTNLHALLEISNPRNPPPNIPSKPPTATSSTSAPSAEARKYALSRRQALLSTLSNLLNQLAARHGIAVLITTGCATRMNHAQTPFNSGGRLSLVPGVGGREWESGIWARACVGRDFGGRWVGVSKVRGSSVGDEQGGLGRVVWFEIGEGGRAIAKASGDGMKDENGGGVLKETEGKGPLHTFAGGTPVRGRKRAVEEIADSDEEDEADEFGGWEGLDLEGDEGGGGLAAVDGGGGGGEQEGPEEGHEQGVEEGAEKAGTIVIDD